MDNQYVMMSANDRNIQIAIAASNIVRATTAGSPDCLGLPDMLRAFDRAFDHILEKTRPIG